MIVLRTETGASTRWQCSGCDDTGVISNWQDTPFDLRRRSLSLAQAATNDIHIPNEIAAALRDLHLLDPDCERVVFGIRALPDGAVLSATDADLEELIGAVAAT